MTDYSVSTNVYNGPMDLLLFLIRRSEVDIYDIPVAKITEQYVHYVRTLHAVDPNTAGEFLVMAATLIELKSRMLLPVPPPEEGQEEDLSDPRLELVRQLLEYKKFKDASIQLGAAAEMTASRWPRAAAPIEPPPSGEVDVEDVQIWDLVAAFTKVLSAIGVSTTHDVVFDDTPITLHAVDIVEQLQGAGGQMGFVDIFTGRNKSEIIGLFLALLELMRQQRVRITQTEMFGPITVTLLSAEPIELPDHWEPSVLAGRLAESIAGSSAAGSEADTFEQACDGGALLDEADEDGDDKDPAMDELAEIKVDVDIEAVLRDGNLRRPDDPTEDAP